MCVKNERERERESEREREVTSRRKAGTPVSRATHDHCRPPDATLLMFVLNFRMVLREREKENINLCSAWFVEVPERIDHRRRGRTRGRTRQGRRVQDVRQ